MNSSQNCDETSLKEPELQQNMVSILEANRLHPPQYGLVIVGMQPNFLGHLDTDAIDDLVDRHLALVQGCGETNPIICLQYQTKNGAPQQSQTHPRLRAAVEAVRFHETQTLPASGRVAPTHISPLLLSYGAAAAIVTGTPLAGALGTVTDQLLRDKLTVVVPLDCTSDHPNNQINPQRRRAIYLPSYTDVLPLLRGNP